MTLTNEIVTGSVIVDGVAYAAEPIAGGAAYELFSDTPAYLLRWRAVDPGDCQIPLGDMVSGLIAMPPHDRIGAPVLGTGFAPSSAELVPEWITTDLADLPLPANAVLVAYAPDGTEVVLYSFQPEQRGWLRLVGPQWRHLLAPIRDISPDQDPGHGRDLGSDPAMPPRSDQRRRARRTVLRTRDL